MVNDKWIWPKQVTAGIYEIELVISPWWSRTPARLVSLRPLPAKTATINVISAKYDGTRPRVIVHTKKYKNITRYILEYSGDLVVGGRYNIEITFGGQNTFGHMITFSGVFRDAAHGVITAANAVAM